MHPKRMLKMLQVGLFCCLCVVFWQQSTSQASAQPVVQGWQAPLAAPIQLARPFYRPSSDYSAGHRGVDYQVSLGQKIFAPADGVISFAGNLVNRPVFSITHIDSSISEFEPACSKLATGAKVSKGEVIATVCDAGADYLPHCQKLRCLHVSLRVVDGYLSPLVRTGQLAPSRLLPTKF